MQIEAGCAIKGLLTYVPGFTSIVKPETGGASSARYCYSVWLRHLTVARNNGFSGPIRALVESGPGDSLGVGLAALLTGVETYYAVDCKRFATTQQNLRILDELGQLFAGRTDIPDDDEFPFVIPRLTDYKFPEWLSQPGLGTGPYRERHNLIRAALEANAGNGPISINYIAPWSNSSIIKAGSIDFVLSQAVMEHVDDIATTYRLMAGWLRPGGFMSHSIDFKSHGFAQTWNGHWTIPSWWWTVLRARRVFAINRFSHSEHIAQITANDCRIVFDEVHRGPAISRGQLAPQFRNLSQDDLSACEAVVQAVKISR